MSDRPALREALASKNPTITPYGVLISRCGEKETIMPSIMATLLRWRTHSAWPNLLELFEKGLAGDKIEEDRKVGTIDRIEIKYSDKEDRNNSASAEFSHRTCLQSPLQTSPPTPQNSYPNFQNSTTSLSGYIWKKLIFQST